MSDGTTVENPRFLGSARQKNRTLSKQQRRKRRADRKAKIKPSTRWKKISRLKAKLHRKVANQRQNWVHQVSTQIVSSNSLVATEKLTIKKMTRKAKKGSKRKSQKTGLNRSMLDVGMGMLRSAIEYKLLECGGLFVEAPTQKVKPSQTCPACGHQQKKDLSERIHNCSCGFRCDRDVAAAMVMLNWATGLGTSLDKHGFDSSTSTPQRWV